MGISIKGKNGRLEVTVDEKTPYSEIKTAITDKLEKNKDFFSGSEAKLVISGKEMTKAQRREIKRLLAMDYDIYDVSFSGALDAPNTIVEVKQEQPKEESAYDDAAINLISKHYFNAKSVFVSHTLRSGQRVECAGDVVVLGDVNVGAEVIAGGSVAVMGALRGLVHAGATGAVTLLLRRMRCCRGSFESAEKLRCSQKAKRRWPRRLPSISMAV